MIRPTKQIALCQYQHVIGGAEMLFYNYAVFLIEAGYAVSVIDWKDGTVSSWLAQKKFDFRHIVYSPAEAVDLSGIDCLLMNNTCMPDMRKWIIPHTCKLAFIEIHKAIWEFHPGVFRSIFFQKLRMDFVRKIVGKKGFAVLETDSLLYARKNKINKCDLVKVIPLPVRVPAYNKFQDRVRIASVCNITTVARSAPNKFYPVIWFVSELERINVAYHLFVVTHNPAVVRLLFEECFSPALKHTTFCSTLEGDNLDDFLLAKADLHIAMGTSVLEGGKLGIPSIILDESPEWPYPENAEVRWLHKNAVQNVGCNVYESLRDAKKGESIRDVIRELTTSPADLSGKTFNYVSQNHSFEAVAKLLVEFISETEMPALELQTMWSYRITVLLGRFAGSRFWRRLRKII